MLKKFALTKQSSIIHNIGILTIYQIIVKLFNQQCEAEC